VAGARPFEGIAPGLDDAADVPGPSGNAAQIFEAVVMRLQIVVADAPVLQGHALRNEGPAVALLVEAARGSPAAGTGRTGRAKTCGRRPARRRSGTSHTAASAAPSARSDCGR